MSRIRKVPYVFGKYLSNFIVALAIISLVPVDVAYYRVESLLSHLQPLGSVSQHIRSAPDTAISMTMEIFRGQVLQVEGVDIHLRYSVNPSSQVEEGTFYSEVLGEDRTYWVYLPPGYEDSNTTYPTLYLLHGMSQGHRWWTEVARVDRIATSMIDSGKIRPFIIVMPNGNRFEHDVSTTSLYDNKCETGLDFVARTLKSIGDRFRGLRIYKISCDGDFQSYISQEMVKEIDGKYRTNGERYAGGFSIGGRGAVQLAMLEGEVFDGAFGLSGNYDFLRGQLRQGNLDSTDSTRLFLASGDNDQRGIYGGIATYLLHKDLDARGIAHQYCTYPGTHSDLAWVSAIPGALKYLLSTESDSLGDACSGPETDMATPVSSHR